MKQRIYFYIYQWLILSIYDAHNHCLLNLLSSLLVYKDNCKAMRVLPNIQQLYRLLMLNITNKDPFTIFHSLFILIKLTINDPLGQKLFTQKNQINIWKIVESIIKDKLSSKQLLKNVFNLLPIMLKYECLKSSFKE